MGLLIINNHLYAITYAEVPEFFKTCYGLGIAPDKFEDILNRIINRLQDAPEQELLFLTELNFLLQGFLLEKV